MTCRRLIYGWVQNHLLVVRKWYFQRIYEIPLISRPKEACGNPHYNSGLELLEILTYKVWVNGNNAK